MEFAVKLLQWELRDAIDSDNPKDVIGDLRQAIMVLNKNIFHQKIMGADPNNQYYAHKA